MELTVDFHSLAEWLEYRDRNVSLFDQSTFDVLGQQVLASGCLEPLTNIEIAAGDLERGPSWREGLAYRGVNSRIRAVMRAIETTVFEMQLANPRIYAAEGLTHFALRMRGLWPRFIGSEFTPDAEQRRWMYPIPCEDLQNLSMASDCFDLVSTNEVLEHVPSIDKALTEICRVLRPGGWHLGTVPFAYFDEKSIRRATIDSDGRLVHLLEPEFHGDPMSENGVLVFEIPGWDILDRALAAGFSNAAMRFVISKR